MTSPLRWTSSSARETRRPLKCRRPTAPSGTAIILFADIADSTATTSATPPSARPAPRRRPRRHPRARWGSVIEGKLLGDGILATFPAASQAIAAALTLEAAVAPTGLGSSASTPAMSCAKPCRRPEQRLRRRREHCGRHQRPRPAPAKCSSPAPSPEPHPRLRRRDLRGPRRAHPRGHHRDPSGCSPCARRRRAHGLSDPLCP